MSKLIKEEQEWFDWDIDQRFNDLYAQVFKSSITSLMIVLRTFTTTCRDQSAICRLLFPKHKTSFRKPVKK